MIHAFEFYQQLVFLSPPRKLVLGFPSTKKQTFRFKSFPYFLFYIFVLLKHCITDI